MIFIALCRHNLYRAGMSNLKSIIKRELTDPVQLFANEVRLTNSSCEMVRDAKVHIPDLTPCYSWLSQRCDSSWVILHMPLIGLSKIITMNILSVWRPVTSNLKRASPRKSSVNLYTTTERCCQITVTVLQWEVLDRILSQNQIILT